MKMNRPNQPPADLLQILELLGIAQLKPPASEPPNRPNRPAGDARLSVDSKEPVPPDSFSTARRNSLEINSMDRPQFPPTT